jgi:invasion protein IalB
MLAMTTGASVSTPRFGVKPIVGSILLASIGTLFFSTLSSAQQVEKRKDIGPWSLFCLKNDPNPKLEDCSIATALVADDDPNAWLRLAFAFGPSQSDVTMTIKTPHLNYFDRGISISADEKQFGKAYIEKCADLFCQTTVRVNPRLLEGFATSKIAAFEYQTNEQESISLAVELKELVPAIGELAQVLGLSDQQWKPEDQTVVVELRTYPVALDAKNMKEFAGKSLDVNQWGTPIKDCFGTPPAKMVKVSANLRIQNEGNFEEWLSDSARCGTQSVFWVYGDPERRGKPNTMLGEASRYKVYELVRGKIPEGHVVYSDSTGRIPLQPPR